jgi:hypothetical protein
MPAPAAGVRVVRTTPLIQSTYRQLMLSMRNLYEYSDIIAAYNA